MGNSEARTNDKIKNKKKIMESIEIEDKIKKEKDNIDKCQKDYENIFWAKIKKVPRKTRIKIIAMQLFLYYSIPKLSVTDKKIAIGALGYFISPIKIIPDIIPIIGYLDDLSILAWAIKRIIANMKNVGKNNDELRNKVKIKLHSLFGEYDENIIDELFNI